MDYVSQRWGEAFPTIVDAFREELAKLAVQEEHGPAKLPPEVTKNLQEGGKAHEGIGPSIGHVGGLKRADFG
jgi:hypothetical protein